MSVSGVKPNSGSFLAPTQPMRWTVPGRLCGVDATAFGAQARRHERNIAAWNNERKVRSLLLLGRDRAFMKCSKCNGEMIIGEAHIGEGTATLMTGGL